MVLRSPFPSAPRTPVPFVAHVGARGCAHCSARPLLQQEHCTGESSSSVLLHLGFAKSLLGSPSGTQRSRRGAGRLLGAGGASTNPGVLRTHRFPPRSHLQPLFFRLSWLTMPRLCPISKEPCPGAADAADPPGSGAAPLLLLPYGIGAVWELGVRSGACSAFVSPRGSPCASPLCSLVLSESPLSYETAPAELLCRKRGLGWGSQQILKALQTRGTRSRCPAQRKLFGKLRCGLGRKTTIYLLKRSAHFSSP